MATLSFSDDLATIRRVFSANRALLDNLPAAREAAQRLAKAGYAGADLVAEVLEEAESGPVARSTPVGIDEYLGRFFEAAGDLGHYVALYYAIFGNTERWEVIRALGDAGDDGEQVRAYLAYMDRAS